MPAWLYWTLALVLLGIHAATAAQPLPVEGGDSSGHGAGTGQQCSGLLLVDRPPNRQRGLFSDIGCDDCASSDDNTQIVAQHVELDVAASITEIVVWGGFWPDDDPVPDDWTIIIHEDAPYQPGEVIYSESPVAASRQTTGETIYINPTTELEEYRWNLTLSEAVALEAGRYWIQVYADSGLGTSDVLWERADCAGPIYPIVTGAYALEHPPETWYDQFRCNGKRAMQVCGTLPLPPASNVPVLRPWGLVVLCLCVLLIAGLARRDPGYS